MSNSENNAPTTILDPKAVAAAGEAIVDPVDPTATEDTNGRGEEEAPVEAKKVDWEAEAKHHSTAIDYLNLDSNKIETVENTHGEKFGLILRNLQEKLQGVFGPSITVLPDNDKFNLVSLDQLTPKGLYKCFMRDNDFSIIVNVEGYTATTDYISTCSRDEMAAAFDAEGFDADAWVDDFVIKNNVCKQVAEFIRKATSHIRENIADGYVVA